MLLWIISFLVSLTDDSRSQWAGLSLILPGLGLLVLFGGLIGQSGCFRADDYAHIVGPVKDSVWTQDIQPKDPKHMRMSTGENAAFMATKVVGSMGAIGSQFQLQEDSITLQKVGSQFLYICPLDFATYGAWSSTEGVPGYVVVDGEDPRHDAKFVELPKEHVLRYTPEAFFSRNLMRHLRIHGYLTTGLTEYTFELDDANRPWWVITTFEPTIIWGGRKVTGVLLVDPTTGEIIPKRLGQIPEWVDRAVPASFAKRYLSWQGQYSGGWFNQSGWWWAPKKGLTEPEEPNLVYGEGDQPEWVIGITSGNSNDDSLVALVYLNSRTGAVTRYEMKGGATDASVLNAVNAHQYVKQRQLHGVAPQLYNVLARPTAVVPIFSENHAFSAVAFVDIKNVQLTGVGTTQYEALREYERVLSGGSGQEGIEQQRDRQVLEGLIDRVGSEVTLNGTSYYIHVAGVPHIFVAGPAQFHKLPLAQPGDRVRIGFDAGAKDVLVMLEFDVLNLPLSSSPIQQNLASRSAARREEQETAEDAATIKQRLLQLSPEQLKALGKQVPPQ